MSRGDDDAASRRPGRRDADYEEPETDAPGWGGGLVLTVGLVVGLVAGIYFASRFSMPPGDSADAELEDRVLDAFENDPVLAERAIEIDSAEAGSITLAGWVRAAREVAYAATLAGGVPGVRAVVNRLRVRVDEQGESDAAPGGGPARA
jgi:hypothetical protein